MDKSLANFNHPCLFQSQQQCNKLWDLQHLFLLAQYLPMVKNEQRRRLASESLLFAIGRINRLENEQQLPERTFFSTSLKFSQPFLIFTIARDGAWRYQ